MTRRARITLTSPSQAALGAGSLTTAGPAAADTAPMPLRTDGVNRGYADPFADGDHVQQVGVGDITGDGKNDLVSRDTAGHHFRNSGTGKGSSAARVKIATGRQGYKGGF